MKPQGGATDGTQSPVYKHYRIHTQRMATSGVWIACIVSAGASTRPARTR